MQNLKQKKKMIKVQYAGATHRLHAEVERALLTSQKNDEEEKNNTNNETHIK